MAELHVEWLEEDSTTWQNIAELIKLESTKFNKLGIGMKMQISMEEVGSLSRSSDDA